MDESRVDPDTPVCACLVLNGGCDRRRHVRCIRSAQTPHQPVHVTVKRSVADIQSVAAGQNFQVVGELLCLGYARALEQDRNDGNASL